MVISLETVEIHIAVSRETTMLYNGILLENTYVIIRSII